MMSTILEGTKSISRWRQLLPGHPGRLWALPLAGVVWASPTSAQESSASDPYGVEIHGFVSQGFIYTTDNNFLAESEKGSFEYTEVGLNFTKQLTDEFRMGAQLFTRDLGPIGNYKAGFDWFYIDYRFFNWLGLRAGRVKIPSGLYNESRDVDAARVPILLPQSNYSETSRETLLAQSGLEAYGYQPIGPLGALSYNAYAGSSYFDAVSPSPNETSSIPYIVGARAQWFTPIDGLSAGFSAVKLELQLDASPGFTDEQVEALQSAGLLTTGYAGVITIELPAKVWIASLEYSAHDFLLAAEYSRADFRYRTNEPALGPLLFPETMGPPYPRHDKNYYVMASYRVTDWFTPGTYYSMSRPYAQLPAEYHRYRHDLAFFVRYDLNPHWLLKLEGHYMNGTAGLSPELHGLEREEQLSTLEREWGAFLVKTTGYF